MKFFNFSNKKDTVYFNEDDEGKWITVRGQHIQIKDGEITKGNPKVMGKSVESKKFKNPFDVIEDFKKDLKSAFPDINITEVQKSTNRNGDNSVYFKTSLGELRLSDHDTSQSAYLAGNFVREYDLQEFKDTMKTKSERLDKIRSKAESLLKAVREHPEHSEKLERLLKAKKKGKNSYEGAPIDSQIHKIFSQLNTEEGNIADKAALMAINNSQDGAKIPQHIKNASDYPTFYYCRHMFPGLAGYAKEDILVDVDTIKQMLPSMVGKPVYVDHQEVELETLEDDADGYVVDAFYNPNDGWAWAKFIVITDAAREAIQSGYSVSNAYEILERGAAGTKHAIDYDSKIEQAQFTHLALVKNPRYEEAKIFTPEQFKKYQAEKKNELEVRNSKQEDNNNMKLAFFKKKTQEVEITNSADLDDTAFVKFKDAKGEVQELPFKAIADAVRNEMEKEKKEKENKKAKKNEDEDGDGDGEDMEMLNDDTDVNIGDIKMKIPELIERWNAICAKKNKKNEKAKYEEDEAENSEEEEEEERELEKEKKAKAKENKKNNSVFEEVRNSGERVSEQLSTIELAEDRLLRGRTKYGSDALKNK